MHLQEVLKIILVFLIQMLHGVDKGRNSFFILPNDQVHRWTYQQFITNDTLINGELYHKLEENGVFEWEDYPIPFNSGSSTYFHQYARYVEKLIKFYITYLQLALLKTIYTILTLWLVILCLLIFLTPSNYTMITRIDSIIVAGELYESNFL